MAGKRREDIPDAGATMQIDALTDDLEELGPSVPALPPPLPPKKASTAMWVIGVLVVVLMMALGVGAGFVLFGSEPAPVVQPAAEPREPEETAPAPADDVVQMEEVVFEAPAPEP